MDKELLSIFGGLALMFAIIIGTIGTICYFVNQQTMECQKINSARTAVEVKLLCGSVN